jgi:hypothetical protein
VLIMSPAAKARSSLFFILSSSNRPLDVVFWFKGSS